MFASSAPSCPFGSFGCLSSVLSKLASSHQLPPYLSFRSSSSPAPSLLPLPRAPLIDPPAVQSATLRRSLASTVVTLPTPRGHVTDASRSRHRRLIGTSRGQIGLLLHGAAAQNGTRVLGLVACERKEDSRRDLTLDAPLPHPPGRHSIIQPSSTSAPDST
eukprot:3941453-Rhodomonas_salina.2